MFANLKRNQPESNTTPMDQQSPAKKQRIEKKEEKKEKKMMFFKSYTDADRFDPVVEKDYKDQLTVQLKDGVYNANVTTAPMTVKFSDVGAKGNLGSKFVPEHAVGQAKFVMTLEQGADSKVLGAMPTIEKDQDTYFNFLKTAGTKMMALAWDEQLPLFASQIKKCKAAAKKEAKKNKDLNVDDRAKELFLDGCSLPVKDYVDEDGDAVPVNKMARRYQYTDRKTGEIVINRPTFWKRNREGGYDDITDKVKFLSKGSVVITQVSFRMYAMSQHYGVATDMGKNIIVVWQKPYSGGNAAPQDTTPEVPFFE